MSCANRLAYRYPGVGGESYIDLIERLRPVILELERQRRNVVIACHIAVLRCIYAYFMDVELRDVPYIKLDSNKIHEINIQPYGCSCKEIE